MAKGVKKIKHVKGSHYPDMSVYGKRITIEPGKEIIFDVAEWLSGTTPEDKKKPIKWMRQSNDRLKIVGQVSSTTGYMFQISNQLCGSYHYYIEASLSGNRDFKNITGLYVKGWCPPKIVSSKWCTQKGGDDVRKTYTFSYGHVIYLYLDTEGLNGDKLTVDVYKVVEGGGGAKDDRLIHTYTNVEVIDGQVNLKIGNTSLWYGKIGNPKAKEEFYVKVKTASGKYVSDGKDTIHARFLRIKNEVVSKAIEPSTNNTPTKVGQPDKNKKNPHKCKFRKITIYDDKNIKVDLFNEGRFLSKINPNDHFYTTREIHYDFNKWDIRADAKPILNKIADFLKENPYLPVELGSHTDCRGTDDYNMALSLKRAQAAVDYLIEKGIDKNRISAKGYGESRLINKGENISEELHQENRRTTLKFKIFENEAQPIKVDILAPSFKNPKKQKIDITGVERISCFQRRNHVDQVRTIDITPNAQLGASHPVKLGKDAITSFTHEVYTATPSISERLYSLLGMQTYSYQFFLHSCAYYSKLKQPTFIINAYPDAKWVYHFQYDYTGGEYFFEDMNVPLIQGIKKLMYYKKRVEDFLRKAKLLSDIDEAVNEIVNDYITEQTDKFKLGVHALHDFKDPATRKQYGEIIDYTEKYRIATELAIVLLFIVQIIIQLFIIWLTKGRGAFSRIKKLRKVLKVVKWLGENGFELIEPKVATQRAFYYQVENGKLNRIFIENVKALPLIGIKYHKELKLVELPEKLEGLQDVIDEYGSQAILTLDFTGSINAEYNVKYNMHTRQFTVTGNITKTITGSNVIIKGGSAIVAKAKLKARGEIFISTKWIPFVRTQDIAIKAQLDAEVGGYITFERTYSFDKLPYYTDEIFFSGIKGEVMPKVSIKGGEKDWDYAPKKPIKFTLFKEKKITLQRHVLFDIN